MNARYWSCALVAALLVCLAAPVPVAAAEGLIYASDWQTSRFDGFASTLREQLTGQFANGLGRADSDVDVLRLVRADPRSVGFVQRDLFVARLHQNPQEFDRLEFYGDIGACLVLVTRKGAPAQTYEQLVAVRPDRRLTLDIGPASGRTATSFELLSSMDPDLSHLELEHRGGARALSRIASGDTDAALIISYAPFHWPEMDTLIDEDAVDLLPLVSKRVMAAALQQGAPYAVREIELGTGGWFRSRHRYRTTCSILGVVVNEKADIRLSEAVAQAMLVTGGETGREPGLGALQDAVSGMVTYVVRWASDLTRMAMALVLGRQDGAKASDGPAQTLDFRRQDPAAKSTVTLRSSGS